MLAKVVCQRFDAVGQYGDLTSGDPVSPEWRENSSINVCLVSLSMVMTSATP
jgi:hypothetical protein